MREFKQGISGDEDEHPARMASETSDSSTGLPTNYDDEPIRAA